jgi:lipoprotein-releasing system ATP-binding protein
MSAAPRIEAHNVTRTLAGPMAVTLVRDIDLAIKAGEFVAITGPSGSGKSSLLYLLGLLDVPSEGEILIDGASTAALGQDELCDLRLEKFGFVFQFHFLLPEFSALNNVLIPIRKLDRWSEAEMRKQAEARLVELDLADHMRKRPDQLSGGQRQRVAIARALANQPEVVLADEPTGNLDTRNAKLVFEIFRRLTSGGTSVVVVTHDPELSRLADRTVQIVDGKIAA